MSDTSSFWNQKQVRIDLHTPLSSFSVPSLTHGPVMALDATVLQQISSGLVLEVKKAYNARAQELEWPTKNIFLPFSKVDYIGFDQ
jgi:hypothetical protein